MALQRSNRRCARGRCDAQSIQGVSHMPRRCGPAPAGQPGPRPI